MEARARRAAAAVGLAAVLVAGVGVFYLKPWKAFAPAPVAAKPARSPSAAGQLVPLRQMQFVTGSVGWVVADGPTAASLLRTTDGGRHWQRQLEGLSGQGWSLSFFDARQGVVGGTDRLGSALWRTADGGQHWTRAAMPCSSPPSLISFIDPSHGWCIGPPTPVSGIPGPFPERQEVSLFRTADGGVHWFRLLATDQAHPVSGGLGDDGQKVWIWFRDAETGWIGQSSRGGHVVVYATTDGGGDWSREELPAPGGGSGSVLGVWEDGPSGVGGRSSPSLVASTVTAGPQPNEFVLASHVVYVWRSSTWTGPVLVPNGAVLVADPDRWLVWNGTSVLETVDAGETWLTMGQVPAGWVVSRLQMVDPDHGWALLFGQLSVRPGVVPPATLARTADGGRHWTLVTVTG